jgi:hypothetical protein
LQDFKSSGRFKTSVTHVGAPGDEVRMGLILGILASGLGIVTLFEPDLPGFPYVSFGLVGVGAVLLFLEIRRFTAR